MEEKTIIRKPFIYALVTTLIIGSFFYFAYFTKSFIFKEEKISVKGPSTIKIGLFSDLHAISSDGKNLDAGYSDFIEEFSGYANQSHSNIVIVNGDIIEGTRHPADTGMFELGLVRDRMEKIFLDKLWLIGNHDLRSVNRSQWKSAMGVDYLDKSIQIDEYKIILLDSNYGSEGKMNDSEGADSGFLLSDAQLAWLENELRNSDKIKIVFMHHPPVLDNEIKKSYLPKGTEKIQQLFSLYEVSAVFSGHVEKLAHRNIDGVDYYIFPGPTKSPDYPGAFQTIRMIDKKTIVTLFAKNEKGEYERQKIE